MISVRFIVPAVLALCGSVGRASPQNPAPPLFEDFHTTNVGALPVGWSEQNSSFFFFHSDVLVDDSVHLPPQPGRSLHLYAPPLAIQTLWCQATTPAVPTSDGVRIEGWFRTDSTIMASFFDKAYVGLSNTTNGSGNQVLMRMKYSPTTELNFLDVNGDFITVAGWAKWVPFSIDFDRAQRTIHYTIGETNKTIVLPLTSPLLTHSFARVVFYQYVGHGYWDNVRVAPHRALAMRVSAKRVLSSAPSPGHRWTQATIRQAVETASAILLREANISLVLVDNLDLLDPGIPQSWYCPDGGDEAAVANLEAAAMQDPTTFLWRSDAVNVYFVHSLHPSCDQDLDPAGTALFPPHRIILLQPKSANGQALALAHELGHHLGLAHTNETCVSGDCGETATACQTASSLTLGDDVADTPPDPGPDSTAPSDHTLNMLYGCGCPAFGCDNGLESHPFHLLRYNLMSYYGGNSADLAVLTEGQRLRMNGYLLKSRQEVLALPGVGASPQEFCFGDGSSGACPCGNGGTADRGCDNSAHTGGAQLTSAGFSSLSNDTISLTVTGLPNSSLCNFYQGDARMPEGVGSPFGDGMQCAGGRLVRLGQPRATSTVATLSGSGPVSTLGAIPAAGATRHYQVHYRDAALYCTPSHVNLSNALTLFWGP